MININISKDGTTTTLQANPDNLFAEVALNYFGMINYNGTDYNFYYNKKKLSLDDAKTLAELQLFNNVIIEFTSGQPQIINQAQPPKMNNFNPNNNMAYQMPQPNFQNMENSQINLNFAFSGRRIMVQSTPTTQFCELAQKFKNKAALGPNETPNFILNSIQIAPDDPRTLKELKIRDQTNIEVVILENVVGA